MKLIAAKEGGEILFTREVDGVLKSLKYSFKDRAFYSEQKNGKWKEVVQLGRFFAGIEDTELVDAFEDGAYRKFVHAVLKASAKNHSASVGKKLSMLGDLLHLEGYFLEGIKIEIPELPRVTYVSHGYWGGSDRKEHQYKGIKEPVNSYQKEVRLLMKESRQTFGLKWERAYHLGKFSFTDRNGQVTATPYKDVIINLVTHIRKNYYMDLEVYGWLIDMLQYGYYHSYSSSYSSDKFDKFMFLLQKYGLEYKTLFDYLVKVERTEALPFETSLMYLKDYISMNNDMGNRRAPRYPDNLTMRHNITARNYKVNINDPDRLKFKQAMEPYDLDWMKGNWAVVTPISPDEIKEEGNKLHHCVAQYVSKVNNGTCVILFMRNFDEGAEPLVTVEYNQYQNAIVQARGESNRDLTREEQEVLKEFAKAKRIAYKDYDPKEDIERDKQNESRKTAKAAAATTSQENRQVQLQVGA